MTRLIVQFTARKRHPKTGEPYQWQHGPYHSLADAEAHAAKMRPTMAREVRVEVLPEEGRGPSHREATKAGIERAKRTGKLGGRPKAALDVARARVLLAEGVSVRDVAKRLGVPRATLQDALKRGWPEKGRLENPAGGAGQGWPERGARESSATPRLAIPCAGLPRIWCGTSEGAPLIWRWEVLVDCATGRAKPPPKPRLKPRKLRLV